MGSTPPWPCLSSCLGFCLALLLWSSSVQGQDMAVQSEVSPMLQVASVLMFITASASVQERTLSVALHGSTGLTCAQETTP